VTGCFDALVVGTGVPRMDGYQLCRSLLKYSKSKISIVMIGAHDSLAERIAGFELGIDDFVTMPCAFSEILARLRAVFFRKTRCGNRVLRVDELAFDLDTYEVTRDQMLLRLNPTGLKLLELFMRRSPAVVSHNELKKALWGRDTPSTNSLRSNIHLLRLALDRDFNKSLLHTVNGHGYRLAVVN
ncbi:XRE family transcriptional regulator, partial [Pseudomonas coronafaciens]